MGSKLGDRKRAWMNRDDRENRVKFLGVKTVCHDYIDFRNILRDRDKSSRLQEIVL